MEWRSPGCRCCSVGGIMLTKASVKILFIVGRSGVQVVFFI